METDGAFTVDAETDDASTIDAEEDDASTINAEAGDTSTGAEAPASFLSDADADNASNDAVIGARLEFGNG